MKHFCATCNSLFSPKTAFGAKFAPSGKTYFAAIFISTGLIRRRSLQPHSLWHDNRHLLLCSAAAPVLSHDHDGMLAGLQRFGEVAERAVAADAGDRLAVDDQRRAGLGFAENFHYASVQLRAA